MKLCLVCRLTKAHKPLGDLLLGPGVLKPLTKREREPEERATEWRVRKQGGRTKRKMSGKREIDRDGEKERESVRKTQEPGTLESVW